MLEEIDVDETLVVDDTVGVDWEVVVDEGMELVGLSAAKGEVGGKMPKSGAICSVIVSRLSISKLKREINIIDV